MLAKVWPATLLPVQVMFHPDIPSQSGGPTTLTNEQVVLSSPGRWKAEMSVPVRTSVVTPRPRDRLLAQRAMTAWFKGRSNGVYIGPFDAANAPSGIAGAGVGPITGITHSDGSLFSDGSGYSQPRNIGYPAVEVLTGALTIVVTMQTPYGLEAGQYFGFGVSELYLIDSSTTDDDGNLVLTFWPPMRSDHDTDEALKIDDPTCLMRLASDDSGQLAIERMFKGDVSLSLVEEPQ